MPVVGIINYGAGNIFSVTNAFNHLGVSIRIVSGLDDMEGVTHVVLPGVGAFGHCFQRLKSSGLTATLNEWALVRGRPFLGICVGMQLLANYGEELGGSPGLGYIPGIVKKIEKFDGIRVPHVGWNNVRFTGDGVIDHQRFDGDYYFDHSFSFLPEKTNQIWGIVEHGQEFVAAVKHKNIIGTQFHPEKSQTKGLLLLQYFLGT